MNRTSLKRLLSAGAFAMAAVAAVPAQAGPFSALYVFGDSLSDNGNNALAGLYAPGQVVTGNSYVPTSAYASARYTNGLVWADYFASMLGVPLTPSLGGGGDFAFGGATTGTPGPGPFGFPFSLRAQTDQYLGATGNTASADALYVVAGGGNNARAALAAIAASGVPSAPAIAAATAAAYADDIGAIVDKLQAAGATHILVWDAPNLGTAPAVIDAGAAALGSFVATVMNAALTTRLAGEAGVSIFDLYGFGSSVAADPSAFGFTNVVDACGAVANANCSQYEYWDGIHPTTAAHRLIADAVYASAVPVPEPETYALMAVGLIAVGFAARRRQRQVA